jgi:hypothetical protein
MLRTLNVFSISLGIAIVFCLASIGCGTSGNTLPSAPTSTIHPQSQPATGPTLGYVWDKAGQALRPVRGVPGASIVGSLLSNVPGGGASIVAAASSSRSGMAIYLDVKGNLYQSPLAGGASAQIASVPGATSLVVSSSGSYVLLTGKGASGTSIAALISGLPQSAAARALDVSTVTGTLSGAVSDTGAVVLASSASQAAGSVQLLAYMGQSAGAAIATLQAFGGMQFVPGSDELIAADGGTGAFTTISHVSTTPVSAPLSTAVSIASPASLDITSNARWAVAANHAGDVLRIDLTGAQAAVKAHCSCVPAQVSAMTGTTLRLVTEGGGPLWIVDASGVSPRVLFVPAITAASVGRKS